MGISFSVSRLTEYYKRHGFAATLGRFSIEAKRRLFSRRMILFYCDLSALQQLWPEVPMHLSIEEHRRQSDISSQDLLQITSCWNPKLATQSIRTRFALGASLWLIRFEEKVAGYGWTLQGRTVEPHYFLLTPRDVHLFDFNVFPQYRGRGFNPLLVTEILRKLAPGGSRRAFIEAAEWNQAQLRSLRKTPFKRLGFARKFTIFRRTWVCFREHLGKAEIQYEYATIAGSSVETASEMELGVAGTSRDHIKDPQT
jgi:ribosomal protein S18 acetylase RimI-like enzyme